MLLLHAGRGPAGRVSQKKGATTTHQKSNRPLRLEEIKEKQYHIISIDPLDTMFTRAFYMVKNKIRVNKHSYSQHSNFEQRRWWAAIAHFYAIWGEAVAKAAPGLAETARKARGAIQ